MRARVQEPEVAFDLAAETFAAAVVSAARDRPGGAPAAAWLLGIARHKLLESIRHGPIDDRARRDPRLAPVALEDDDLPLIEERAAAGAAPVARAARRVAARSAQGAACPHRR
jgi:RNA polymerase sigma-70 factor (ECF subfamily)